MTARFGGPQGVYLPRTQQELTAVMKEMDAGPGETIVRILEQSGDPGAILRFGAEDDLIKILQDPATSMACDCGASTATRVHPRFYGSFPRLLGRYVREQQIMSWEQAIRKSSWLPAATIGMTDRGLIALGMAADIVVFDPATIIDHATYENPAVPSEGVKAVLVNGRIAVKDGVATGGRGGLALLRSTNMPSRSTNTTLRSLSVKATGDGHTFTIDLTQGPGLRQAVGRLSVDGVDYRPGFLQSREGWASVSGSGEHAIAVTVDRNDPTDPKSVTIVVSIDGAPAWRVRGPGGGITLRNQ